MRHLATLTLALALALLLAAVAASAATPAQAPPPPTPEDQQLLALLQEDLDAQMQANPVEASMRGDRRFDRLLPDMSEEGVAGRLEAARDRLRRLRDIDRAKLSEDNRLNAALLEHQLEDYLAASRFKPEQIAVTQQDGPQIYLPQLPEMISFTTDKQLEDYAARLAAVPAYIDQTIANMREGLEAGRTPPAIVLRGVVEQVTSLLSINFVTDPTTHPAYRPFLMRPSPPELAESAQRTLRDEVTPAFIRLRDFLRDEYVPGARQTVAVSAMPDGEALYNYLLSNYTTTDMTAQEIHDLGLSEVARIRAEMMEVIARSDFPRKNELQGVELFNAFVEYLRSDPRFYHESAEALLAGYRDICKKMDAEIPLLFGKLPRLTYGVREMPRFIAPAGPTAYYYPGSLKNGVSGTFIANTYRLEQRPRYEMVPLALHEAVPGHHLQIALMQELEDAGLPEWRTTVDYTVFVEGWGLYSERLGLEVGGSGPISPGATGGTGFYEDPYDDFGRLTYEMWRALRLVVDTGLHAFNWERERAIQYMAENSALTRQNIESEVDRYIAMPGQAVAYKIGELKLRELRAMATEELGDAFDVRAFHDVALGAGAVPLGVLERRIKDWVQSRKNAE